MNVQTMSMDPRVARIHYLDYRAQCKEHKKERMARARERILTTGRQLRAARTMKTKIELEDEELMKAYYALARGKSVINLAASMKKAGLCAEKQLPRLAIVRADFEHVKIDVNRTRTMFYPKELGTYSARRSKRNYVDIPAHIFGAELWNGTWRDNNNYPRDYSVQALAPKIPPRHHPGVKNLDKYYLLWEPKWEATPPDPDPMLLSRIGDNFFAVVAVWDMTPLEQSVLEGRISG